MNDTGATAGDADAASTGANAGDAGIAHVAVVGAGRMGHGIALAYARCENVEQVTLYDADEDVLAGSCERIESALATLVAGERVTPERAEATLDRIERVPALADCVAGADLVTEAVVEDLEIKRAVFERLDEHAPADALLATNTSGLSIDDVAEPVGEAGRVLGTHWFNPPYLVPLVEVVKGSATRERPVERAYALLETAGKTPVVVEKDVPGFIGNRIQTAMSYEAFSLLARGVATPEAIDRAVKAGFGFRLPVMGVFGKMDQSGLEIHLEVERNLLSDLDRGTDPNAVVTELVERGQTGTDAGRGVYDWTETDLEAVRSDRDEALLSLLDVYEAAAERPSPPANYDRT
jgi:3-hydroxyacyl-CoA dehydrogenase